MKYKGLGGTDLLVSKFALGTMIFRGKNFPMSVAMGALNKQDRAGREHFPFLNDNCPYSPSTYLKKAGSGSVLILPAWVLYVFYCTNLSNSGCNLVRKTYNMMAPTRNATASAMTSDQTTPWKPFI